MNEGTDDLDRTDTLMLKGIAIFAIATHNFLHVVRPEHLENEFDFVAERLPFVLNTLVTEPQSAVRMLSGYFGHFGVQMFMFLSAYGLTKSFLRHRPSYGAYMVHRFDRVYPAFLLSIVLWALWRGLDPGWPGPVQLLSENAVALALKLGLVSNLVPGQTLRLVGPWWFVPFIFQFYAVFPMLHWLQSRRGNGSLIAVAGVGLVITALAERVLPWRIELHATFLAHLPELCVGMILAARSSVRLPTWLIAMGGIGFVAGNLNATAWYLTHTSALVLMLGAWPKFRNRLRSSAVVAGPWLFLGGISLQLFLVNGITRQPFLRWASRSDSEVVILGWALVSLSVSIAAAVLLRKSEALLRRFFSRGAGSRARGKAASDGKPR